MRACARANENVYGFYGALRLYVCVCAFACTNLRQMLNEDDPGTHNSAAGSPRFHPPCAFSVLRFALCVFLRQLIKSSDSTGFGRHIDLSTVPRKALSVLPSLLGGKILLGKHDYVCHVDRLPRYTIVVHENIQSVEHSDEYQLRYLVVKNLSLSASEAINRNFIVHRQTAFTSHALKI